MTALPQPPAPRSAGQLAALAGVGIVCGLLVGLGQFIGHVRTDEMDPWLFAYCGRQLLRGSRLYVDLWDIKAPGIFWIDAIGLWLGGGSLYGVWALCCVASVATVAVFYRMVSRLYCWQVAAIATVIAALFLNFHAFHMGGNRPATFYVLTETAAVAAYLACLRAANRRSAVLIMPGVCAGIGFCIKQTTFAALPAIAVHVVYSALSGHVTWREATRRFALLVIGWFAAVGVGVCAVAATGDLGWAWDAVFRFNLSGFGNGGSASVIPRIGWVGRYLTGLSLPLILASVGVGYELYLRWFARKLGRSQHPLPHGRGSVTEVESLKSTVKGRTNRTEDEVCTIEDCQPALPLSHFPTFSLSHSPPPLPHGCGSVNGLSVLLCAWLVAGLYAGTLDPLQRPWHLAIALPPLMLLVAHGVSSLFSLCKWRGRAGLCSAVCMLGLVWLFVVPLRMQIDMAGRQYRRVFHHPPDAYTLQLAQTIRAYSRPDETVFCFDYRPDVLWLADRPPAVRYLTTVSTSGWDHPRNPLMNTIADEIEQARPKTIVYSAGNSTSPRAQAFDRWLGGAYEQPEPDTMPELWVRTDSDSRD